jgi:hypothetical protein
MFYGGQLRAGWHDTAKLMPSSLQRGTSSLRDFGLHRSGGDESDGTHRVSTHTHQTLVRMWGILSLSSPCDHHTHHVAHDHDDYDDWDLRLKPTT